MDLKRIVDRLGRAPFTNGKSLTIHQLADEKGLAVFQLVEWIHQCMVHLDEQNPQSFHKQVSDLRSDGPERTVDRMLEFLSILKYPSLGSAAGVYVSVFWVVDVTLCPGVCILVLSFLQRHSYTLAASLILY